MTARPAGERVRPARRSGFALLLVALAVAMSAAQVLDATALAGVEAARGAAGGPGWITTLAWLWPAWFAIPLLVWRRPAFRVACMVLGACPILAAGIMGTLAGGSGLVAAPDVLFVVMYEVPGFPGAMVLLMLAALASYGSRREAETAALTGILLAVVAAMVTVFQALLLSTAGLAG